MVLPSSLMASEYPSESLVEIPEDLLGLCLRVARADDVPVFVEGDLSGDVHHLRRPDHLDDVRVA